MALKGYIHGYLRDNLGDDLLVAMLVLRVPQVKWRVYVDFQNRAMRRLGVECVRPTIIRRAIGKIQRKLFGRESRVARVDCYVSIGGSMYQQVDQWEKLHEDRLRELNSLEEDTASFVIDSNFGPYHSERFASLYKQYFERFTDVCFRDAKSQLLFGGVTRHAPDLVFSLDIPTYEEQGTVISVVDYSRYDRDAYLSAYERLVLDIVEKAPPEAGKITFMSFCEAEGDEAAISRLFAKMPPESLTKCEKYFYRGDFHEAVQVVSRAKYIVGGRFHSMVLGMVASKPTYTLAYSDKTTDECEYLRSIGLLHGEPGCISASQFSDVNGDMVWKYLLDTDYERIDDACRALARAQLDGVLAWAESNAPQERAAVGESV